MAVEPGEQVRNHDTLVERLAAEPTVVSVTWSARDGAKRWHAVDGRIRVAETDTGSGGDTSSGGSTGTGTEQAMGLFALAEQLTGLTFSPDWLDLPHLVVRRG